MKPKNHVGVNIQQWKTEMETKAVSESGTVAGIMPSDYFLDTRNKTTNDDNCFQ